MSDPNSVMLVTGASRGIGAATARLAATRGYAVCVNYRADRAGAEAVRRMARKFGGNGGAIVNVSSAASKYGSPDEYVDYAASKGAIDTFTLGLAAEVAGEGIRVNAVRPGFIATEMHASGGEPDRIERVKHNVPLRRGGTADEVAQAILWLLSAEASFTTGAFIDVAGGR